MTDKCRYDFSSCLLSGLVLIHDVHLVMPMQLSMNGWLAGWCVCTCGMASYGWCVCVGVEWLAMVGVCVCRCEMAGWLVCVCVGVACLCPKCHCGLY